MPKKKRNIKGIDIDPDIERLVKDLASELGVTESQIFQYFTAEGLLDVKKGSSGLWSRLKPSKSIRYKYNIDIDDLKKQLFDDD